MIKLAFQCISVIIVISAAVLMIVKLVVTPTKHIPTSGQWDISSWGPCQNKIQTRTVACPFDACTPEEKPVVSKPCKTSGDWTVGSWGPCRNTQFGGNVKTRTVECDYDVCYQTKPTSSESCFTPPQTSGDWTVGSWGPCRNTQFGGNVKTRKVVCDYEVCNQTKPETSQQCSPDVPPTSAWDPQKNLASFIKAVYISSWNVQPITKLGWKKVFEDLIDAGYNVLIMAFLTNDPDHTDTSWSQLATSDKRELVDYLHSKKVVWLVSIGGANVIGSGPSQCTFSWIKDFGQHCVDNLYDGVDLDLERVTRKKDNGECNKDLVAIANALRKTYAYNGKNCVITSAPQSPYFNTKYPWAFDYISIEKLDPNAFDFYNIQFYNNGLSNTKDLTIGSLRNLDDTDKLTAYNIHEDGIPKNKIVIGKVGIGCEGDGTPTTDFYVPGKVLQNWTEEAGMRGVMYWTHLGKCTPESTIWLNAPS